jgi:4-hydroxy-3-polyprenylbenzoate decarboxylase
MKKHKIAIAITGASGSIYAKVLLDKIIQLQNQIDECVVVMSNNAKQVWAHELGNTNYANYNVTYAAKTDFQSPIASGSAGFDAMLICPCSMGTLSRVAHGISDDLITRAADVMLKERKKLILITRETPLNLIHIKNMENVTSAGGIICPATPSFYSLPKSMEELALTVVDRALQLANIETNSFKWGTVNES